ncbi:hypothetical protein BGW36DRAFT_289394 [Talaromyces proteolyticus]|uniref:Uncharacterized protein n=1 Tax=Talaromyces proteolyticus TaxID=1131652 RepID=A0AAD4Q3Z2_9EURO|nr:uncharacterized protein BGW36DRAFT_289394 [Talaromyces proteolyticus]KAH8702216.1 hypothetical protein BGW36DRAFT_289394 [Talaromyces proteolyticus]
MFGSAIAGTAAGREAWIRRVIFVGLYLVLLQSLAECVLVLYLYGTRLVDEFMTPSLIIGLVASFLSVPFVVLHTLLSWQYRKIPGSNLSRNALHIACSHLPRIMIVMWLSASVAGLVTVSKQAGCLSLSESQQFWKAGVSCQIHRSLVVIDMLSFFTSSALFFCFQVCQRPYDASLLSIGAPQRAPRDGSIFSESSWESETLKHEIFYLCRHPDAGPGNGELYWSPNDSSLFETPVRPPSIRYSGPNLVRPQLHVNTRTNSVRPSISTLPTESSPKSSPLDEVTRSTSFRSNVSQNPSLASTLRPGTETAYTRPLQPELPDIAESPTKVNHQRQKSSVSSQKFLPKGWTASGLLSEDPQIRALASPPLNSMGTTDVPGDFSGGNITAESSQPTDDVEKKKDAKDSSDEPRTRVRSMTEPNGVPPFLPSAPLVVRKSRTSYMMPKSKSIHHPHHPDYVPPPPPKLKPLQNAGHGNPKTPQRPLNRTGSMNHHVQRRHTSGVPRNHSSMRQQHRQSPFSSPSPHHSVHHPEQHYPRRTQTQYRRQHHQHMVHPQPRHPLTPVRPAYTRRFHSNDGRGFDPSRALPPIPCSDDTATLYPSTRRPRSSTYGGVSGKESVADSIHKARARRSLNLADGGVAQGEDQKITIGNTYRGAERTSFYGAL